MTGFRKIQPWLLKEANITTNKEENLKVWKVDCMSWSWHDITTRLLTKIFLFQTTSTKNPLSSSSKSLDTCIQRMYISLLLYAAMAKKKVFAYTTHPQQIFFIMPITEKAWDNWLQCWYLLLAVMCSICFVLVKRKPTLWYLSTRL